MHSIVDKVKHTIATHGMVPPGARVLVAVSGGPDSVCLVHVLKALGYTLALGHLDHQTREGASAEDAAFVRKLADQLGVPLHEASQPVAEEAAHSSLSFEAYAREARYTALLQMALDHNYAILATGHHAGDQAETVLMRVMRGTSPGGLAGIPPVRTQSGITIVRPLIDCRREAIMEYLSLIGVEWRTDESNADTAFVRNRVRHDLLPALRATYNPQIDDALNRLADVQRDENEYLNGLTRTFLKTCCPDGKTIKRVPFATAPVALQRRGLVLLGWRYGIETPFDRIDPARRFILESPSGSKCDLGGGVLLRNGRDVTEVLAGVESAESAEATLIVPGDTHALGKQFVVRVLQSPPSVPMATYCTPRRQVFDGHALGNDLTVRTRRDGDRFTPFGMTGTRKLQDYFVDLGLPQGERDRTPIVFGSHGIAWVVGHAIAAPVAVTAATTRWLEIEVTDDSP